MFLDNFSSCLVFQMNFTQVNLSNETYEFIKNIGKSRSKQDEDRIIIREVEQLKGRFSEQNKSSVRKMKENIIEAIYCEMLGHDASPFHIHAVNLVQEKSLSAKRLGYLACTLFLNGDNELMILLINSIQKDLTSTSRLEVSSALSCLCTLLNQDVIPVVFPLIKNLLKHTSPQIRKKACLVLSSIFISNPDLILHEINLIREILCDPDPSVMGASLHVIHEIAKTNPFGLKDLAPSLCSILRQVYGHRLPKDFTYHRVPSPWLQVKLLSILSLLGSADKNTSQEIYDTIFNLLKALDMENSSNFSILYECVKTISKLYPNPKLLELAASSITRFIASTNNNLKYAGIIAITNLIQIDPSCVVQHQLAVVDCLQDPDETLKSKTLELLYRMINRENVDVIVNKLIQFLSQSSDALLRENLAGKITESAVRFSPGPVWYVDTMNKVLKIAGKYVKFEAAYNLIKVLSRTPSDLLKDGTQLKKYVLTHYLDLLSGSSYLADSFIRVIAWALGEYGTLYCPQDSTPEDIQESLIELTNRKYENELTRSWILTALVKLTFNNKSMDRSKVLNILGMYKQHQNTDIQQRAFDGIALLADDPRNRPLINLYPSDINFSTTYDFSFLDVYVKDAIRRGAAVYDNDLLDKIDQEDHEKYIPELEEPFPTSTLKYAPYEKPTKPLSSNHDSSLTLISSNISSPIEHPDSLSLPNVPKRWGPNKPIPKRQESSPNTISHDEDDFGSQHMTSSLASMLPGSSPDSMLVFSLPSTPGKWGSGTKHFSANNITRKSPHSNDINIENMRQKTEKEIIAAALFKGLSNNSVTISQYNSPEFDMTISNSKLSLNSSSHKSRESNISSLPSADSPNMLHQDPQNDLLIDYNPKSDSYSIENQDHGIMKSELDALFDDFSEKRYEFQKSPTDYKIPKNIEMSSSLDTLPRDLFPLGGGVTNPIVKLTPYVISASQFALEWPTLPHENKQAFRYNPRPMDDISKLFSHIKARLDIYYVQIIEYEAIATAKDEANGDVLLIHLKCDSQMVNVILKSHSESLMIKVFSSIGDIISKFQDS